MATTSIVNNKGGVAKTSTAVNLASILVSQGKRVLFVDLDKQGNGTSHFGIDKTSLKYSIYHLFKRSDIEYSNVKTIDVIQKTACGVDVLPANLNLEFVEYELINRPLREFMLKKILDEVKDKYDEIIIDCPPSLGIFVYNALTASDYIIITTQPESPSLEGIPSIAETYKNVKSFYNPHIKIIGVLMTMVNKRVKSYSMAKSTLENVFGKVLFKTEIRRSVKVSDAHNAGKPLAEYDSSCDVSLDYKAFTKEYLERCKNGK